MESGDCAIRKLYSFLHQHKVPKIFCITDKYTSFLLIFMDSNITLIDQFNSSASLYLVRKKKKRTSRLMRQVSLTHYHWFL